MYNHIRIFQTSTNQVRILHVEGCPKVSWYSLVQAEGRQEKKIIIWSHGSYRTSKAWPPSGVVWGFFWDNNHYLVCRAVNMVYPDSFSKTRNCFSVYRRYTVASELKDPIWHSLEWQIGSFSSEATIRLCRSARPKGSICLFVKWTDTAFWLCTAVSLC